MKIQKSVKNNKYKNMLEKELKKAFFYLHIYHICLFYNKFYFIFTNGKIRQNK